MGRGMVGVEWAWEGGSGVGGGVVAMVRWLRSFVLPVRPREVELGV